MSRDADKLYEVVSGVRVTKVRNVYACVLAGDLSWHLRKWNRARPSGLVTAHAMYALPGHDLRPDVSFVSFDRWPPTRRVPRVEAWPVVPDVAAEVAGPNEGYGLMPTKLATYFAAGVRSVWLIDPEEELVYAHFSPTVVRVLSRGDELTDSVLPGFRLPVADLFPPSYVPQ